MKLETKFLGNFSLIDTSFPTNSVPSKNTNFSKIVRYVKHMLHIKLYFLLFIFFLAE